MKKRLLLWLMGICLCLTSGCTGADGKLKLDDIPRENIVAVNIVSASGDVTVKQGGGEEVRLSAEYFVRAQDGDRRRLIRENLLVTSEVDENGLLTIYSRLGDAVTLGAGGRDEEYEIDLTVQIPKGFGSVVVQSQKGDISLDGLRGVELLLLGNNGDISVRDTSVAGTSSITGMLGDIDVRLRSIEDAEQITVSADLGDLSVKVPGSASYTVTVQELSRPATTWKNKDGKTQLFLSASVGTVNFQN